MEREWRPPLRHRQEPRRSRCEHYSCLYDEECRAPEIQGVQIHAGWATTPTRVVLRVGLSKQASHSNWKSALTRASSGVGKLQWHRRTFVLTHDFVGYWKLDAQGMPKGPQTLEHLRGRAPLSNITGIHRLPDMNVASNSPLDPGIRTVCQLQFADGRQWTLRSAGNDCWDFMISLAAAKMELSQGFLHNFELPQCAIRLFHQE